MKIYMTYDYSYIGLWTLTSSIEVFSTKEAADAYIDAYFKETEIMLKLKELELEVK